MRFLKVNPPVKCEEFVLVESIFGGGLALRRKMIRKASCVGWVGVKEHRNNEVFKSQPTG